MGSEINKHTDGRINKQTDGWIGGWTDERTDGQAYGSTERHARTHTRHTLTHSW